MLASLVLRYNDGALVQSITAELRSRHDCLPVDVLEPQNSTHFGFHEKSLGASGTPTRLTVLTLQPLSARMRPWFAAVACQLNCTLRIRRGRRRTNDRGRLQKTRRGGDFWSSAAICCRFIDPSTAASRLSLCRPHTPSLRLSR